MLIQNNNTINNHNLHLQLGTTKPLVPTNKQVPSIA